MIRFALVILFCVACLLFTNPASAQCRNGMCPRAMEVPAIVPSPVFAVEVPAVAAISPAPAPKAHGAICEATDARRKHPVLTGIQAAGKAACRLVAHRHRARHR